MTSRFKSSAGILIVPAIFVLLMKNVKNVSPSVDPDDPASQHYDGGLASDDGDDPSPAPPGDFSGSHGAPAAWIEPRAPAGL